MEVYTLGTSNRGIDEFISILKAYGIELVVDVRRFPTSKFEHFKKENIERHLRENGFEYFYLGDLLGGFREGGYQKYMESDDFGRGLQMLIDMVKRKKTAIICREKFPWRCHRWQISRKLTEMGFRVVHILDEKRTYIHKTL